MSLLLKLPVVARELSVGRTTLCALIRDGKLPVRKIGRSTRVHRADLEQFAARLPTTAAGREGR